MGQMMFITGRDPSYNELVAIQNHMRIAITNIAILHGAVDDNYFSYKGDQMCSGCGVGYPCPTMEILNEQLGKIDVMVKRILGNEVSISNG